MTSFFFKFSACILRYIKQTINQVCITRCCDFCKLNGIKDNTKVVINKQTVSSMITYFCIVLKEYKSNPKKVL